MKYETERAVLAGRREHGGAKAGEAEAWVIPRGAAVVPTCCVRRVACRRVRRPRRARRRCPRARRPAARGERPSAGRAAAHVGFAAVGARPGCSGPPGPSRAARRAAARGRVLVGPAAGEQLRARARGAAGHCYDANSNPNPHSKPHPHPNSSPNPHPNLGTLQILQSGGGGGDDSLAVATAAAQAVPPLEDAVRGNPSLWPAHANLATIYSGFGDRLRALGALQRAIDILVIRADGAPAVRVKG